MQQAIMELSIGEAVVSPLGADGSPCVSERAWMLPPASQIGPLSEAERHTVRRKSAQVYGHYEQTVDRESAYEKLRTRTVEKSDAPTPAPLSSGTGESLSSILLGSTGPRGGQRDGLLQSAAKSAARAMGSGIGRAILRGALGSILGGASRSRS
jgi:hypothetical protein